MTREASTRPSTSAVAVAVSVPGSLDRAAMLSNLSFTLRTRSDMTDDPQDLDAAVAAAEQALLQTPARHPDLTTYLTNLAITLTTRHSATDAEANIERALECYERAASIETAPPLRRLFAARWGGQLAASVPRPETAAALFHTAVSLIGYTVPRSLDRGSQEESMARIQGLAGEVTAWNLAIGEVDDSLTWVELSRAVLWGISLNDLQRLRQRAPEFADRVMGLEALLNQRVT
jgi:tetratricopeptide (TPR) repeat protein